MRFLRLCSLIALVAMAACGDRLPAAPSSLSTSDSSATFASNGFGQLTTTGVPDLATCLREPSAACVSFAAARRSLRVGIAALSAPINLSSTVAGTTVTLAWTAPTGTVASYVIEAGSSSGFANLASFSTGNSLTTFTATGVSAGTYYVRVRAVDSSETAGPSSNEVVVVVVGGGPCVPPGAPTGLTTTTNAGGTVGLRWNAASGSPTSYVLEAGSVPGTANLANTDVGAVTTFTASGVGAGTYYVRVRATSGCGTSGPSNEITIIVGVSLPPPTGRGSMSAKIDGVPWTAIPQAIQVVRVALPGLPSGLLAVNGTDRFSCPILLLTFAIPRVVGTYALGPGATSGANASLGTSNCAAGQWSDGFGGSGSITLTTLTSTGAAGTFSFNLTPSPGTTGTRVVTDGVFNVTF